MKWARLLEVAKRRAWSTTRKEAAERSRRLPPVFDGWNCMIGMFTKPVEWAWEMYLGQNESVSSLHLPAERDGCLGLCRTRELEIASNTIVLEGGLGDTQSCMDRPNKGIAEAGAKPVERRGLLDSWICAMKIATIVGSRPAKYVELGGGLNQQPCGRNLLWMVCPTGISAGRSVS